MGRILLSLVIGILLCAVGARVLAPSPQHALPAATELPAAEVLAPMTVEPALVEPEHAVAGPPRASVTAETEVLISDALRRYAQADVRKSWKDVRSDEIPDEDLVEGMQTNERIVLESPQGIGASLAVRRTKVEEALAEARTGGVFSLLVLDMG